MEENKKSKTHELFFLIAGFAFGIVAGANMLYISNYDNHIEVDDTKCKCDITLQLCELNKSQELYKCYSDLDSLISVSGCRQQKTTVKTCNIVQGECSEREQFYWMC